MRFAAIENFWLFLGLPILALFAVWAFSARQRLLCRFLSPSMVGRLTRDVSRSGQYWKYALTLAGMLFLIAALTGPQFGATLAMAKRRGVDVVIALDVSRSMSAQDIRPNRLERARFLINGLLDHLQGDRVGLVLFAGKAFVQCPLTLDYGAFRLLLSHVDSGSIPVQGTAIGEAISLALACFDAGDLQHKAIVLLTDGEDHVTDASKAAQEAAAQGARIFAVGMGTPDGQLIPVLDQRGGASFHKDRSGNYVKTRLDEKALTELALTTNGVYFRAGAGSAEIEGVYDQIANMEQKELGSQRLAHYEERYQIPLALALLLFALQALLSERRARSADWQGRFA
jgi:Ca-activated chloride channel family protein